ncbi:MAG: DNA recombination protein RmuC [Gammaproteobacteria bacterium]
MNELTLNLNHLIPFAAGMVTGAVLLYLWLHKKIAALQNEQSRLQTTLELERQQFNEKNASLAQARQQLADTFNQLSGEALRHNSETFLKLAEENLKKFQAQAEGQLQQKEKAVENLIKPIKEALDKTEQQIREVEKERKEAYGSLHKHLETMALTQASLQDETRNLVQALRRPEVRGQWGELTLKRLAELAGMVEHCDFYEQEQIKTENGNVRPDMIVRMPDRRDIVVDAKTPLDAYLRALDASTDEARLLELQAHARHVRERVKELASKSYWASLKNTPDFVVLFIPGDQFLSAALDQDKGLLEFALQQKVILSTPTSLVALLRAIAYGWRQEQLAENAEHIRQAGEDLYARLLTYTDHLGRLGKSLESSVKHYNSAVGSFDTRVLPGARKFAELGVQTERPLNGPDQVVTAPRIVENTPD